ncbi:hypothetical protein OF83DRAFT_614486 [Amylostereum chailletii]|nr:hypothetical protein OF83DRAFT_614486 [Amylostereum chailletii]
MAKTSNRAKRRSRTTSPTAATDVASAPSPVPSDMFGGTWSPLSTSTAATTPEPASSSSTSDTPVSNAPVSEAVGLLNLENILNDWLAMGGMPRVRQGAKHECNKWIIFRTAFVAAFNIKDFTTGSKAASARWHVIQQTNVDEYKKWTRLAAMTKAAFQPPVDEKLNDQREPAPAGTTNKRKPHAMENSPDAGPGTKKRKLSKVQNSASLAVTSGPQTDLPAEGRHPVYAFIEQIVATSNIAALYRPLLSESLDSLKRNGTFDSLTARMHSSNAQVRYLAHHVISPF